MPQIIQQIFLIPKRIQKFRSHIVTLHFLLGPVLPELNQHLRVYTFLTVRQHSQVLKALGSSNKGSAIACVFKRLTATVKIHVFWNTMLCRLVNYRRFGGVLCLNIQGLGNQRRVNLLAPDCQPYSRLRELHIAKEKVLRR